jgi:hypothetical protein
MNLPMVQCMLWSIVETSVQTSVSCDRIPEVVLQGFMMPGAHHSFWHVIENILRPCILFLGTTCVCT